MERFPRHAESLRVLTILLAAFLIELATAEELPKPSWIDQWREATVALGRIERVSVQDPSGKRTTRDMFIVVGTGVIFAPPGQTSGIPWLITAKHVFVNPEENWDPDSLQLRFAWFEREATDQYLGIPIKLKEKGKRLWIADPDASVDLAAIQLVIPKKDARRETVPAILPTNFVTPHEIFEGARVSVFGYPGAVGPKYSTRAIVRSGAIAWVDPTKPADEPLLIDALIYPGNSGGPVFREPTGMTREGDFRLGVGLAFLGIVSQGRRQSTPLTVGGKPIQFQGPNGSMPLLSESWMGIGVVESASRVLRLLEQAAKLSKP